MSADSSESILVLNSGSTSLKAGLFVAAAGANFTAERALLTASASGLGQSDGQLKVEDEQGRALATQDHALDSQEAALREIAAALRRHGGETPAAVGHRIVHGGPRLREHTQLTPTVLATLRRSIHFAPLHLPGSLRLVQAVQALYPETPQFACFDTAFHRTMPPEATRLPVPREFAEHGVQRYGFHGLSYESQVAQLRAQPEPLPERLVCAHLGGGSSLCAIRRGKSIDTTMGLSPTGGVPMATRSGDLDPGVLLFMAREKRLSPDALESLLNTQSGLAAICGTGDMQQLEAQRQAAPGQESAAREAELAFSIYTTAIAKAVVSLTVSLGGLDLLVFAGGIGEHSAPVRAAVLAQLAPFGLRIDAAANQAGAPRIDAFNSKVPVRIVPAEEDRMIAFHTRAMLRKMR